MRLRVLGCAGGESPDARATAFLINDNILLDAGSVVSTLSIEAQAGIDHIVITHPHLDHIKDLGFILDNTFGMREQPLNLVAPAPVLDDLRKHIFNWVIWPDFSQLPSPEDAVMRWLQADEPVELDGLRLTSCRVNHPGHAYGYLVEDLEHDVSVLVTGDTSTTEDIWQLAIDQDNLAAVFVDVAFPERLSGLGEQAGHYCPSSFAALHSTFPRKDVPFYVYHMKPALRDEVIREVRALNLPLVKILEEDDQFDFSSSAITHLTHKVHALPFG